MGFTSLKKLDRHTLFVDDDSKNYWSPQRGDTIADAKLVENRAVHAVQESIQVSPLVESLAVEPQVHPDIEIRHGLLWDEYKLVHKYQLGGKVAVVLGLPAKKHDYLVRKLSVAEEEVLSFCKRRLTHENLCKIHEVFEDTGNYYCVMEPAVVTLRHVCRCPKYPNKEQLVAITKQMLAGVAYLSSENLFHRLLNIDNVVINSKAVVKINKLEYCEIDKNCSPKNTKALGRITMMLMDRFAHEEGEIAVRQPHDWPETAVDFLSSTRTGTPDALLRHEFMQQEFNFKELVLHVLYVQRTALMD